MLFRLPPQQANHDAGPRVNPDEREALEQAFDHAFYLYWNPDVSESGIDPLDHYLLYGWKEGRDPTPNFSTTFYLATYPDVRSSGVNPFWHFLVTGRAEGRTSKLDATRGPNHSQLSEYSRINDAVSVIQPYFDDTFYLRSYPEVEESGLHPLVHFCTQGWREGKDPSDEFSVSSYLQLHPDVAAAGVNPFWHYLVAGKEEGRLIKPLPDRDDLRIIPAFPTEMQLIGGQFDAAFYLSRYVDVAKEGLNPLEHYWHYGWREGRDPSTTFSTTFYLESNPDVADQGINPLWHYIVAGKNEGRLPQHPGGYRVERLRKLDRLEEEARRWTHGLVPGTLLHREDVVNMLVKCSQGAAPTLMVSIGHDHYLKVSGGVQLCVHREETVAGLSGSAYLYVHPWQALPRLSHLQDGDDPIVCLVLNGEDLGASRFSDLVSALELAVAGFDEAQVIIHQLLGHSPELIVQLVNAVGSKKCWLWLHDFLTICPSYTLQRNSVAFCGAPPLGSNACTLCRFGDERRNQADRMLSLFKAIDVHVLSPSQVTLDLWEARSGLTAASVQVVPHMTLNWRKRTKQLPKSSDRVTIGFLGTPAPHKGWQVFEALFRRLGHSGHYRFVFLGSSELPAQGIDYRRVHVTATDPDAMISGVREEKIDLVLHWASWPETFSLSTYEAYAGGAYVITNDLSGNVAVTVSRLGRGAVLADEADLNAFFEDGRAAAMVRSLRIERRRYEVRHELSRMVHDAIDLDATRDRP